MSRKPSMTEAIARALYETATARLPHSSPPWNKLPLKQKSQYRFDSGYFASVIHGDGWTMVRRDDAPDRKAKP